jgi:branched-chain amino acid transport system substrate-binding protein
MAHGAQASQFGGTDEGVKVMKFRSVVSTLVLTAFVAGCGGTVETEDSAGGATSADTVAESPASGSTDGAGTTGAAVPDSAAGSPADTAGTPASGEPIRIGVAVAQTGGGASALGQDQVVGVNVAVDYFNERGGVNGRPIEVDIQDTLVDEAGAINAFNTLLSDDSIVGIIGPTLSQQALAADPIADQAGMPVVAPSNTAAGIPDIGDFIARVSSPIARVAPNAIAAALEADPAIEQAVVLYAQNDSFAKSETDVFQSAITDAGVELVQPVLEFQTTDTDFTTQVNAVLDVNPQLVVISGLATDGGNLVRQLRETGYEGTIVAGNGMNTRNIFKVCQASCDGLIIAQAYSYSYESAANDAFREQYRSVQGEEPLQIAAQAFTAVQVFVDALTVVDAATPIADLDIAEARIALNDAILAGSYDTVLGPLSFEPNGEVIQDTFYVAQVAMTSDSEGDFTYLQ